jgi:alkylhydroperoxidase/carboxymuconolactone decarboxylase family protein YurZ
LALLAPASLFAFASCDWMQPKEGPEGNEQAEAKAERDGRIRRACASQSTYDRLKELAFDEAARVRGRDPRDLDALAAATVVRMENPVPTSRDEGLNVTVCRGRIIFELPPGVENAFDGERRLVADIEYAAQAAADGSGLVFHMEGAEPVVYRLATAGGLAPRAAAAPEPAPVVAAAPHGSGTPAPQPEAPAPQAAAPAAERPAAPPVQAAARPNAAPRERNAASPSFNCNYARTRSERMVCGSAALAGKDRQMAAIYYAAMANGDAGTRSHLRRSRDAFLVRRERCGTEDCVAAIYDARIQEIRRIAAGE